MSNNPERKEHVVKVTLNEEDVASLRRIATRYGISANDALKKAIATEIFFEDEVLQNSSEVFLKRPDGFYRNVEFPRTVA